MSILCRFFIVLCNAVYIAYVCIVCGLVEFDNKLTYSMPDWGDLGFPVSYTSFPALGWTSFRLYKLCCTSCAVCMYVVLYVCMLCCMYVCCAVCMYVVLYACMLYVLYVYTLCCMYVCCAVCMYVVLYVCTYVCCTVHMYVVLYACMLYVLYVYTLCCMYITTFFLFVDSITLLLCLFGRDTCLYPTGCFVFILFTM